MLMSATKTSSLNHWAQRTLLPTSNSRSPNWAPMMAWTTASDVAVGALRRFGLPPGGGTVCCSAIVLLPQVDQHDHHRREEHDDDRRCHPSQARRRRRFFSRRLIVATCRGVGPSLYIPLRRLASVAM